MACFQQTTTRPGDRSGRAHLPALLLAATLLGLAGCIETGYSESEHLERAQQFQAEGDLAAASIELRNVLQQDRSHAEARHQLGQVLLQQHDYPRALVQLREAQALGHPAISLRLDIAHALSQTGDHEAVLDTLQEPAGMDPDLQRDTRVLRGRAFLNMDQIEAAATEFHAALDARSEHAPALTGLAQVQFRRANQDAARALLEQALQADPEHADAWELRGHLARAEGHREAAEHAYSEVIRHARDPYVGHYQRAITRASRGDTEGARIDLVALENRSGEFPLTRFVHGLILLHERDFAGAAEAFDRTLLIHPSFWPAIFYGGVAHYASGNFPRAEHHLGRVSGQFPRLTSASKILADIEFRRGNTEGADERLDALLRDNPSDLEALNLLAALDLKTGRPDRAIERLGQIVTLQPDSPHAHMRLASIQLQTGEFSDGRATLESARHMAPETAAFDILSITQHLETGDFESALAEARELARKHPEQADAHTLVGVSLLGLQQVRAAEEAFSTALEHEPGHFLATRNLAIIAMTRGEVDQARTHFVTALDHRPHNLELLLELASFEAHQGELDASRKLLQEATTHHPDRLQPHLVLARVYLNSGAPVEAGETLERVESTFGHHPEWIAVRARVSLARERPEQAITLLNRLPESAPTQALLGEAFQHAGRSTPALQAYRRSYELDPELEGTLKPLTELELEHGDAENALETARRMRDRNPSDAGARILEARSLMALGRPEEAIGALTPAHDLAPSSELTLTLYSAHLAAEDREVGIRALRAGLERSPRDDRLRLALAYALQEEGHHAEALPHLEQLAHRHGNNTALINNLALAYFYSDDERAEPTIRKALDSQPEDPRLRHTGGLILSASGNASKRQEAVQLLRHAYRQRPEDTVLAFHYARALAGTDANAQASGILREILRQSEEFPERAEAEALLHRLNDPQENADR